MSNIILSEEEREARAGEKMDAITFILLLAHVSVLAITALAHLFANIYLYMAFFIASFSLTLGILQFFKNRLAHLLVLEKQAIDSLSYIEEPEQKTTDRLDGHLVLSEQSAKEDGVDEEKQFWSDLWQAFQTVEENK